MKIFSALICILLGITSYASEYPKVDADLAHYDQTVAAMKSDFNSTPANPLDKSWVTQKLAFMYKVDQYMRSVWNIPYNNQYTEAEMKFFFEQFDPRSRAIDIANTQDLKELLKVYQWFKISEFGEIGDNQAWIIVQHADLDPDFQKQVLSILGILYPLKETLPKNYAYLFDRVAASFFDLSKRTLQRYGTQGQCVGSGKWEPIPMEDPKHVDDRRAAMGMSTMAEYMELFKNICH